MLKIRKLSKDKYAAFTKLFCDYFDELGESIDKEIIIDKIINNQIIKSIENRAYYVDLMTYEDKEIGFIIYQIDSSNSDWNEREGQGFIREFYIEKEYRNKGLGSLLLKNAESKLKKLGATSIYLTSGNNSKTIQFYESRGYENEHVKNKYNKLDYFSKKI